MVLVWVPGPAAAVLRQLQLSHKTEKMHVFHVWIVCAENNRRCVVRHLAVWSSLCAALLQARVQSRPHTTAETDLAC